jgi:hypothetical protein
VEDLRRPADGASSKVELIGDNNTAMTITDSPADSGLLNYTEDHLSEATMSAPTGCF